MNIRPLALGVALLSAVSILSSCSKEEPVVETLSINSFASDTLYTGREYHLSVSTSPQVSDPRLSWSVSDASLASIQYGGLLKPLSKGELTVYVTSLQSGGRRVRASRKFVLISSGVYLRDRAVTINPLETYRLGYRFLPEDYKPTEALSWRSSDEAVATVDSEGVVRGLQDGEATIYVRLGNPLSGFFSEDSVAVTVEHHEAPRYTYTNGELDLTQSVPGLLPMVAKEMPYFSKISIHGPINGSDLLFFIENKERIDALDLSDTHVVSGGRTLVPRRRSGQPEPSPISVTDGVLPPLFAQQLLIKSLTLPKGLTSLVDFGLSYTFVSLTVPEGYEELHLGEFATEHLTLPKSLRRLYCNQPKLFEERSGGEEELKISSVKEPLILPEGLRELRALLELSAPLTIPSSVEEITLTGRFDDVLFASPTKLRELGPSFFLRYPNQYQDVLSRMQAKTLRLPEGLQRLSRRALAAGVYGSFIRNQDLDEKNAIQLDAIIFPSSLRSIDEAALFAAQIAQPVILPEGLESIGLLAFYASSLSEVTLPASLRSLDDQAFALCPRLETVHALGKVPPTLGAQVFLRTAKQGRIEKLIVPRGSKPAYVQAGYAPFFFTIEEATK